MMKKSTLFATVMLTVVAMLTAVVMHAGKTGVASTNAKKGIKKITLTPAMLKQIQMKKAKPIDWSFLPETIAEVNGKKINKKVLISFFESQIKMMPYPVRITTAQVKKFAHQLVDQMVSQQILLGLAAKAGFKPSAEMVKKGINSKLKELKPVQLNMMKQQLAARKTTVAQFIKKQSENPMIQKQYAIGEWVKSKTSVVKPTDAAVKAFYDKNKDNPRINQMLHLKMSGDPAGSIRASHILIKVDDKTSDKAAKAKAEAILAKLKKGASFEDMARKNSDGGSAKAGGSLGAFKKGQMVKAFEKAAFALKVGEMSGLVKTRFGYHIIRRDKSLKTTYFPYATVKAKIAAFISAQKERGEFAKFVKTELAKAKKAQNVKILVK